MKHHPARLIERKRDGGRLSADEIRDLVGGVVDRSLEDVQLGAFLMAVCWRGLDADETAALTLAMRDSGRVMAWRTDRPVVDKHSTGGVGDKVSLVLAPLLAAAGAVVPMVSGRGLGHTGGTLDKLASIDGYRTDLAPEEFARVVETCGFAMAGADEGLAPADRRMYAARDVSGTVPHRSLITASILAKKLAEGLDGLVMDVKVGRGAFLPDADAAAGLADMLVTTGARAGLPVRAVLTRMDEPLGLAIGNALEVAEALECLDGAGPQDLRDVVIALGAEALTMVGIEPSVDAARTRLGVLLDGGDARECLLRNVRAQGGRLGDGPGCGLPTAPVSVPVVATHAGWLADVDPRGVGDAVVDLGGGRRRSADAVDPAVGVRLGAKVGDRVDRDQILATVFARTDEAARRAVRAVGDTMAIRDVPVAPPRWVYS